MSSPFFSIVTPVKNGEKYIENTIKSVLNQTYSDYEIILVDDGSTDSSINKVLALENKAITLIKNHKNIGLSKTRKKLLLHVRSKWLAFIDQDDTWERCKIEKQINRMKAEKCGMSHTHYNYISQSFNHKRIIKSKTKVYYKDMLSGKSVGASTVLINTTYFDKLATFCDDRYLDPINDYIIWLNLFRNSENYSICVEEPLMNYYFHGDNLSANKLNQLYKHFYVLKNIEKISFVKIIYHAFMNIINKMKAYYL